MRTKLAITKALWGDGNSHFSTTVTSVVVRRLMPVAFSRSKCRFLHCFLPFNLGEETVTKDRFVPTALPVEISYHSANYPNG